MSLKYLPGVVFTVARRAVVSMTTTCEAMPSSTAPSLYSVVVVCCQKSLFIVMESVIRGLIDTSNEGRINGLVIVCEEIRNITFASFLEVRLPALRRVALSAAAELLNLEFGT